MTEGEGKRRFWRRGSRKKKAATDASGAAAETPASAGGMEGTEFPEDPEGRSPQLAYEPPGTPDAAGDAAGDGADAEGGAAAAVPGSGGAAEPGAPPKKGRRRGRRRGRKPSDGSLPPADAVSASREGTRASWEGGPPPGAEVSDENAEERVEEPETPARHLRGVAPAPIPEEVVAAAPEAQGAQPQGEPGRKRRRR
ncbi:MAG: hypothetical protein H6Q84_1086, partial [Deltaproteobacteria bacterium]|nr:hypothetical protein [Deltaproteobacteria bacterium]